MLSDLTRERVHVQDTVIIDKTTNTGSCYICVNKEGDRMIMAYSGAADLLTLNDLPLEALTKAKWAHLSDMRNIASIEALLESDFVINFSMSPGALIAQNPSRAFRLAQHAKLIVGSRDEMSQIFRCSEEELDDITSDFVKEKSGKIIAITKGSEGATIFSDQCVENIPIFKVPVVDTTGAGDAFTAGMLYALTKGRTPKEAGRIAAACSAICIQEIGARSGPKNRKELVRFLRKNQ